MREEFLPFSPPWIGQEEIDEVADTLRSGWLSTGPKTRLFEQRFAARLNSPAALALNSCTAGLHTALATLGIGPGDEVITTPITFAATVNVIEHVGARPVLADVEPDTLNIDPRRIEAALTPRTKAVIPVHFTGHPVEMEAVTALTEPRGVAVIEDAAHALPAKYRGRWIGESKRPVAFSFYATKNLTTGEGGMLTGDPDFLAEARIVALHGMSREAWRRYEAGGTWKYDIVRPGFKYNMSDIQSGLGLRQLEKLEAIQRRRRQIVAAYHAAFASSPALETPVERDGVEHAWHLYVLRIRPERLTIDRDQFVEEMKARKIGTSVHFIPIHFHSYYRNKYGWKAEDFPVAAGNYERSLSLPLNPVMTDGDVADVIEAVLDVCRAFGRRRAAA